MARNILGGDLECCCSDPVTGFYRNGKCDTDDRDPGMHTVCVNLTDDFLEFARDQGNDLITPMPQFNFPGLKAGNRWCVCVATVVQAIDAGRPPQIHLNATHSSVLEFITLKELNDCAVEV
jgi:uncharacterized protein (DUF2237 family)